jgi:hypothetical protein
MKKTLIALALVATSITANARVTAADCEDFGDIVGSMQDIRNQGGAIGIALSNLQNLVKSSNADSRALGQGLTEVAQYIWSKPQGNMTRSVAVGAGTAVCNQKYR